MKPLSDNSKIGWMIHTYGPIEPKVYFNHMSCMINCASKYHITFLGIDKHRTADSRNILVQAAKSMNCTHLLSIDSDHLVPPYILECLSKNKDAMIVSGLITKRKPPFDQVGFVREGDLYCPIAVVPDGRSYLVDMPAMGCTLFDMKVFDMVDEPYFVDQVGIKPNGEAYNRRSDSIFFEKCYNAGIKMIVDSRVLVGHLMEPEAIYPNCVPNTVELNRKDKIRQSNESLKHQNEVYEKAKDIAIDKDCRTVLDLGCGNPTKLVNKLGFVDNITGIDFPEKILDIAVAGNKANGRAEKNWLGRDLNEEFNLHCTFDLIIAADVIEHLADTDTMLESVVKHMDDDSIFVISSPDSKTTAQDNPLHVREFTSEELFGVLLSNNLEVIENFSYQEMQDVPYTNNVFVCKKVIKESKNGDNITSKESSKDFS